jgi:hypothetical protein
MGSSNLPRYFSKKSINTLGLLDAFYLFLISFTSPLTLPYLTFETYSHRTLTVMWLALSIFVLLCARAVVLLHCKSINEHKLCLCDSILHASWADVSLK